MPSDFAEIQAEAARRWQSLTAADRPWLRVGTALCGQAAGAEETAAALETALQQRGIAAPVSRVGCLGLCFAEPLVDVLLPGQPRVFTTGLRRNWRRKLSRPILSRAAPWPTGYWAAFIPKPPPLMLMLRTAAMAVCPT